jgi:hypothetical protein
MEVSDTMGFFQFSGYQFPDLRDPLDCSQEYRQPTEASEVCEAGLADPRALFMSIERMRTRAKDTRFKIIGLYFRIRHLLPPFSNKNSGTSSFQLEFGHLKELKPWHGQESLVC